MGVDPCDGRPVFGKEGLEVVGWALLVMGQDPWGCNPSWGGGGVVGWEGDPCCAGWAKGESEDVMLGVSGGALPSGDSLDGVVILGAATAEGGGVLSCPAFGSVGGVTVNGEGRLE